MKTENSQNSDKANDMKSENTDAFAPQLDGYKTIASKNSQQIQSINQNYSAPKETNDAQSYLSKLEKELIRNDDDSLIQSRDDQPDQDKYTPQE